MNSFDVASNITENSVMSAPTTKTDFELVSNRPAISGLFLSISIAELSSPSVWRLNLLTDSALLLKLISAIPSSILFKLSVSPAYIGLCPPIDRPLLRLRLSELF